MCQSLIKLWNLLSEIDKEDEVAVCCDFNVSYEDDAWNDIRESRNFSPDILSKQQSIVQ